MDVVFPIMPFADVGRPSMGVSLLIPEVRRAGHSAEAIYFNLDLAGLMGIGDYQRVASEFPPNMLLGEWVFADDLFGDDIPAPADYFDDIFGPMAGGDPAFIAALMRVRTQVAGFLDACVATIMAREPRIVGFSTVFHQTCACLAVARRLKALPAPPVIVFGGANCEGEMGLQLISSFPWIDYVCSGEADLSFPALLDRLLGGADPQPIGGVLQQGQVNLPARSPAVTNLDALPYPDFEDYFGNLSTSALAGLFKGHLVFESSRGCWWGAKHHCTFCGLNGDTMVFRSKKPDRVFEEIDYLLTHYESENIGCVDNILDLRYIDTLFARLAASPHELKLFYEVKANLRLEQLVKLRAGGVNQIQPGIESFSDAVLTLMSKGCTGFQNIQLMRWCREVGIEVSWNILGGFPGEDPAEYERMAALIPRLTHLDPPCSCGMVRLDRFSPFHGEPDRFGFTNLRPAQAYFYVFPLGRRDLSKLAYFFDFDYPDRRDPQTYLAPVQRETRRWIDGRAAAEPPRLDAHFAGDRLTIFDSRSAAVAARHDFAGLAALVYARCDRAATVAHVARDLGIDDAAIEAIVADFDARRLVARDGDRVLSLAVFRDRPAADMREVRVAETAAA